MVADDIACSADVDIVGMLRAEGEVQNGRVICWAQLVSICLLEPVVSYFVPLLYHAGQYQAAIPILLSPVQHLNFWSGDLLCQEGEEGSHH